MLSSLKSDQFVAMILTFFLASFTSFQTCSEIFNHSSKKGLLWFHSGSTVTDVPSWPEYFCAGVTFGKKILIIRR